MAFPRPDNLRVSRPRPFLSRFIATSAVVTIGTVLSSGLLLGEADYRKSGDDHFYNLEFDEAIADYTKLIQQNPADPMSYNDLASAQLNKEMYSLGLLDSSALGRDNRFLREKRPVPDPNAKLQLFETLERGRHTAETALSDDSRNARALYALCTDYALRADYEFMVERAWFAALHSGSKSRGYCDQAHRLDAELVDVYLVLGVYEYATGSLPLSVKMFAAIGGIHGNKKKGMEYVSRVAREGNHDRDAARVLLAVLYRREKRPLEAAAVLQGLMADYPRNYIFNIELASMYSDAGQLEDAVQVLNALLRQADENPVDYQRLPRNVVEREMKVLEARLHDANPEARAANPDR
jgi:tetratricopeptide (TPR) repeat protein